MQVNYVPMDRPASFMVARCHLCLSVSAVSCTNFMAYCKINEAQGVFYYDFRYMYNTVDQAADHIFAGHIAMTEYCFNLFH